MTIQVPPVSAPIVDAQTGLIEPSWYLYLTQLARPLAHSVHALIDVVADTTYIVLLKSPVAFKISSVSAQSRAGIATLSVSISGVSVPVLTPAIAASTALNTVKYTTGSTVPAGQTVTVTVSGSGGTCRGLAITLTGTTS